MLGTEQHCTQPLRQGRFRERRLLLATVFCLSLAARLWGQASPPPAPTSTPPGSAAAAAPAPSAVAPDEGVRTSGDHKFTAAQFDQILQDLPAQYQATMISIGKKQFASQYANLLSLSIEAEERHLDQTEEFRHMVDFDRKMLLAQLVMNDLARVAGAVSADEVREYYDSHPEQYSQVHVRGIYVPFSVATPSDPGARPPLGTQPETTKPQLTEQEAQTKIQDLRRRVESGEDMAALAKAESDHPTASAGGDFGFLMRGQLAPELTDTIFSLAPGQLSEPVRDRFGFFLLRVEEKRVQPLLEVQAAIQTNLSNLKLQASMQKLQQSYAVTLNPRYFPDKQPSGEPAPAPAP